MKGVVVLYEIIHEMYRNKLDKCILTQHQTG